MAKSKKKPIELPPVKTTNENIIITPAGEYKPIYKKSDRLVIVGCADSKNYLPPDHENCEFWGVNNLYLSLKRNWTRWFEIHHITHDGTNFRRRGSLEFRGQSVNQYLAQLSEHVKCPIYMQKRWSHVPQSVEYPLNHILATFSQAGGWFNVSPKEMGVENWNLAEKRAYFTNTISYMLCLGILEGFKEIYIIGVDMAVATEYGTQRSSCEVFLGWAIGKGIKIFIPDDADLLKTHFLYGFHEPQKQAWDKKVDGMLTAMQKRQRDAQNKLVIASKEVEQYTGAMAAAKEMKKIWD